MPRNPKDPGCQSADGCGCTAETPVIRIGTGRTHEHDHAHNHDQAHEHDHAHDHAHDHDHAHSHDHADASCVVCDVSSAQASPRPGYLRIRVLGLDCAEEVATLRRALAGLTDPERIEFNTLAGLMDVPEPAEAGAIVAAVARTGMRALVVRGGEAPLSRWQRSRLSWLAGASGVATVVGLAIQVAGGEGVMAALSHVGAHDVPPAGIVSYAIAVAAGLYVVLPKAWYAARTLRPDMNLLMTLAVAGAIGLGEWLEAATVAFLFALSLALESWSVGRARSAVEKLLALAPAQVEVQREGRWIRVDPGAVAIGERILVRAGERVGLDGQIVHGSTTIDQAPITGESAPVERGEGDEVYAGTINGSGVIEVRTTALATDTTLARIIAMVGEARRDRSDAERWVERFARWYTPLVLGAAVLVAVLPPLLLGGLWTEWFYRALVLLVIGCPCALVISTPVAVVAGLAAAARHGVLVKSGRLLEVPARLKAVAFDKTGTLTEASLGVLTVVPAAGTQRNELVELAAAISSRGTHPAARAIVRLAEQEQRQIVHASGVQNLPGRGASGQVAGREVWVGSWRLAHERGAEAEPPDADASTTRVYVGVGAVLLGFFELGDTVRSTAVEAISRLREVRIGHIVMLSGDQPGPAKAVGRQVGIDDVRAGLLPADKLAAIEAIERDIGPVAMVGDGVNDAPALARASLGIAMGALGTDVAIETADVALMSDDPTRIAWLVEHSRRTLAIIHQNTVFALGIKAVFVVATMLGAASMWGAIAADTGASLLVVLNALRLLRAGGR